MRIVLLVGVVLATIAGSQALEVRAQEPAVDTAHDGRVVFDRSCSICHGAEGGGRIGPALDGNLNLARSDYVTAIILRGRDGMPSFAERLTETEVAAVAEYVRGAWGNDFVDDEAEAGEGNPDAGERAVDGSAGRPEEVLVAQWWRGAENGSQLFERICARCHGEDGGGGFGPPLVRNDNLSDAQYVVGKILHGQGGMPAFEGLLSSEQVALLAEFIRDAFGNDLEAVDLELVRSLQSTRQLPGSLRVSVYPGDSRLSILGPDRFVRFVSSAEALQGPVLLDNLLPGTYTVAGTVDGYSPAVAEVQVLPLHRSSVTLRLGVASQVPANVEAAEGLADGTASIQAGSVTGALPAASEAHAGGILYRRSCAMCHGPEGGGGIGPPLAASGALQNVQFVLDRILNGTSVMPSFADRLTPLQIAAIASFERSSWGNSFGAVAPEQVAAQQRSEDTPEVALPDSLASGAEIYEEYCAACHGGLGFGGVGPALQGNVALADLPYTVSRIVMGGGGMPSFHEVLSTAEMAEVASFIRDAWGNDFGPVGIFRTQNYHGGTSGMQQ